MPPLIIPPLVKLTIGALGAVGAGAAVHWLMREARRMSDEIDRVRPASQMERAHQQALPTLRRDPGTGDWRLM
jgi:hypothetical protein